MSVKEYLHGKKQSVGLTKGENEVLTYLAELDPLQQQKLDSEWFKEHR